jgi:hypothetical protein
MQWVLCSWSFCAARCGVVWCGVVWCGVVCFRNCVFLGGVVGLDWTLLWLICVVCCVLSTPFLELHAAGGRGVDTMGHPSMTPVGI